MNRIATATIIKGSGIPLKIINDRLDAETIRVQQEHESELAAKDAQLNSMRRSMNRQRSLMLEELKRREQRERTLLWKIKERISITWAWLFCLGLGIGLWKENGNE